MHETEKLDSFAIDFAFQGFWSRLHELTSVHKSLRLWDLCKELASGTSTRM